MKHHSLARTTLAVLIWAPGINFAVTRQTEYMLITNLNIFYFLGHLNKLSLLFAIGHTFDSKSPKVRFTNRVQLIVSRMNDTKLVRDFHCSNLKRLWVVSCLNEVEPEWCSELTEPLSPQHHHRWSCRGLWILTLSKLRCATTPRLLYLILLWSVRLCTILLLHGSSYFSFSYISLHADDCLVVADHLTRPWNIIR